MESRHSRNDLPVNDVFIFRKIEDIFRNRCRQFGYDEIKTSTIEHQYIFTAKEVLSAKEIERMIDFFDKAEGWGGEPVVLRPDSSPCVARLYNQYLHKHKKAPRKKYCYVENQFVLSDSKDAISERWQCGVEHIGLMDAESETETVYADMESIYLAYDILQEIVPGNFFLYLSYPSIIREMINLLFAENEQQARSEIQDSIKTNNTDKVKEILASKPDGEKLLNLLTLQGESVEYLIALKDTLQGYKYRKILQAFENFIAICQLLDNLECDYLIDFSLLGELDYYTGIRFQIYTSDKKSKKNILCSGGRYDNLISNMYENVYDQKLEVASNESATVPATGFALYLKNIIACLSGSLAEKQITQINVKNISGPNLRTAKRLCSDLSRLGFMPRITFGAAKEENVVIFVEVDEKQYETGFKIKESQKIDDQTLLKMVGWFNDR